MNNNINNFNNNYNNNMFGFGLGVNNKQTIKNQDCLVLILKKMKL